MKERREIVALWRERDPGVLITLVRAEGSSYRRPGARLLTSSSRSSYAGTISGGCLEGEIIRKAAWITRDGAAVERYAMTFDDTADIPFGLGCGGTVDLLFEPSSTAEAEALRDAMSASLHGQQTTVVTFLPDAQRPLRRLIFNADQSLRFSSSSLSPAKIACARQLQPGNPYEGRYVERLEAPQRLFVLGAGDDAKPLSSMGALLGWSVIIADGRAQLARSERFPEAEAVIPLVSSTQLSVGPKDAVVIMTHSYEQDRDLLTAMLLRDPAYLGILGSRHRSSLLIGEAAALLQRSIASCCDRLYAPVGLDLGGDGPEAIALAVIAEVQAVCSGRNGSTRRLHAEDIKAYIAKGGGARYLQAVCALDTE